MLSEQDIFLCGQNIILFEQDTTLFGQPKK